MTRGLVKARDFSSSTSPVEVTVEASWRTPNSRASLGETLQAANPNTSPRFSSTRTLAAGSGMTVVLILRLVAESSVFRAPSTPASRFREGLAVRRRFRRVTVSEMSFVFRKSRERVGLSKRE